MRPVVFSKQTLYSYTEPWQGITDEQERGTFHLLNLVKFIVAFTFASIALLNQFFPMWNDLQHRFLGTFILISSGLLMSKTRYYRMVIRVTTVIFQLWAALRAEYLYTNGGPVVFISSHLAILTTVSLNAAMVFDPKELILVSLSGFVASFSVPFISDKIGFDIMKEIMLTNFLIQAFVIAISLVARQNQTKTYLVRNQLERARDEALEASKLKSQFVATMSHEIRTPLNGIIGLTGFLLESPLNVDQYEWVQSVQTSARVLLSLASHVLDFSRLEAGRIELQDAEFNLHDLVDDVVQVCSTTAASSVEIFAIVDDTVPRFVIGDCMRVQQILVNLLSNACKFTSTGEIVVHITQCTPCGASIDDGEHVRKVSMIARAKPPPLMTVGSAIPSPARSRSNSDNNLLPLQPKRVSLSNVLTMMEQEDETEELWLSISVEDTGIGMDEKQMQRLFAAFSQADGTSTRRYDGAGLGLHISQRIAVLMGGYIEAKSEKDSGSTFTAVLKFVVNHRRQSSYTTNAAPPLLPHSPLLRTRTPSINVDSSNSNSLNVTLTGGQFRRKSSLLDIKVIVCCSNKRAQMAYSSCLRFSGAEVTCLSTMEEVATIAHLCHAIVLDVPNWQRGEQFIVDWQKCVLVIPVSSLNQRLPQECCVLRKPVRFSHLRECIIHIISGTVSGPSSYGSSYSTTPLRSPMRSPMLSPRRQPTVSPFLSGIDLALLVPPETHSALRSRTHSSTMLNDLASEAPLRSRTASFSGQFSRELPPRSRSVAASRSASPTVLKDAHVLKEATAVDTDSEEEDSESEPFLPNVDFGSYTPNSHSAKSQTSSNPLFVMTDDTNTSFSSSPHTPSTPAGSSNVPSYHSKNSSRRVSSTAELMGAGTLVIPDDIHPGLQPLSPSSSINDPFRRPYGSRHTSLSLSVMTPGNRSRFGSADLSSSTSAKLLRTPSAPSSPQSETVFQTQAEQPVPSSPFLTGRILVAEDNTVNQMVMRKMLTTMGHNVVIASNGDLAVKLLFGENPRAFDVVLMDIHMPVMDGYGATREIRDLELERNFPRVPIVAVTACSLPEDQEKCEAAGMDDFVSKPVDKEMLGGILKRHLSRLHRLSLSGGA